MKMLDLFSGTGGASGAFKDNGWEVVTLDSDKKFNADIVIDVREFHITPGEYDFIWASPPCTFFTRSSMPWYSDGDPSTELVEEAMRIIKEGRPEWWVIENVRGSVKWLRPLLGEPVNHYGPFYLWGVFPIINPIVDHKKGLISGTRPDLRAQVPYSISLSLQRGM